MSASDGYITPVVVIHPPGSSIQRSPSTKVGMYYVVTPDGAVQDMATFQKKAVHVKASLHVRGQSTGTAQKAQYGVKLHAASKAGERPDPPPFLEMPYGGTHWVFNAPGVVDHTLLRNVLAFDLQRKLGQWAPRTRYFELFLAKDDAAPYDPKNPGAYEQHVLGLVVKSPQSYYRGVYLNFEKIDNEPNRIPLPDYHLPGEDLVGAFIAQINPPNPDDPAGTPKYGSLIDYSVRSYDPPLTPHGSQLLYAPKNADVDDVPGVLPAIRAWYLGFQGDVPAGWAGRFAAVFNQPSSNGPTWDAIRATTDYPSFAVYFVLNEMAFDPDGYHKSTFMFKTADQPGTPGKMHGGPLWDKNKSYGNGYSPDFDQTDKWLFQMANGGQSPVWWHVLVTDPELGREVMALWKAHAGPSGVLSSSAIDAFLDEQVTRLKSTGALERNNVMMGITDHEQAVAKLKRYVAARLSWMGDNLAALLPTAAR